jgi:hypothetical protein
MQTAHRIVGEPDRCGAATPAFGVDHRDHVDRSEDHVVGPLRGVRHAQNLTDERLGSHQLGTPGPLRAEARHLTLAI